MRIALGIEYDGSGFCGWQFQKHSPNTIQQSVEAAVSKVANEPITTICAGRTDAGVHATAQVLHFDTNATRTPRQWVYGINTHLPNSVVILWAQQVSDEFHARFKALRRSYRYVINVREVRPSLLSKRVTWSYRDLDADRMHQAAQYLIGEHDFTSYRTVACQAKSPVRDLYRCDVTREGDFIFIDVEANGFLHHMVRNIAGVLMKIGANEAEIGWSKEVLEARDRTKGGITAPAYGLYLNSITYPDEFSIPNLSSKPVVW